MSAIVWTPERVEIVRKFWTTTNLSAADIAKAIMEIPGRPVSPGSVSGKAKHMKLHRPPNNMWSPERDALLFQDWQTTRDTALILGDLNALPGDFIREADLRNRCIYLKVKRPIEALREHTRKANLKNQEAAVRRQAEKKRLEREAQQQATKGENGQPAHQRKNIFRQFVFSPKMMHFRDPAAPTPDQINAWIATHGVTKCPTVAVEATTATIPQEDLEAISRHQEFLNAIMEQEIAPRRAAGAKASKRVSTRQSASVAQRKIG